MGNQTSLLADMIQTQTKNTIVIQKMGTSPRSTMKPSAVQAKIIAEFQPEVYEIVIKETEKLVQAMSPIEKSKKRNQYNELISKFNQFRGFTKEKQNAELQKWVTIQAMMDLQKLKLSKLPLDQIEQIRISYLMRKDDEHELRKEWNRLSDTTKRKIQEYWVFYREQNDVAYSDWLRLSNEKQADEIRNWKYEKKVWDKLDAAGQREQMEYKYGTLDTEKVQKQNPETIKVPVKLPSSYKKLKNSKDIIHLASQKMIGGGSTSVVGVTFPFLFFAWPVWYGFVYPPWQPILFDPWKPVVYYPPNFLPPSSFEAFLALDSFIIGVAITGTLLDQAFLLFDWKDSTFDGPHDRYTETEIKTEEISGMNVVTSTSSPLRPTLRIGSTSEAPIQRPLKETTTHIEPLFDTEEVEPATSLEKPTKEEPVRSVVQVPIESTENILTSKEDRVSNRRSPLPPPPSMKKSENNALRRQDVVGIAMTARRSKRRHPPAFYLS